MAVLEEFIGNYDDYMYTEKNKPTLNTSMSQKANRENSKPSQAPSPSQHELRSREMSLEPAKPTKPATKARRGNSNESVAKSQDRTQNARSKNWKKKSPKRKANLEQARMATWPILKSMVIAEQVAQPSMSEQNDLQSRHQPAFTAEWERSHRRVGSTHRLSADLNGQSAS